MGYYTYTEAPIGNFIEKEHGHNFEYSLNEEQDDYSKSIAENYPHKVWVGSGGQIRWRQRMALCEGEEDCGLHHRRRRCWRWPCARALVPKEA